MILLQRTVKFVCLLEIRHNYLPNDEKIIEYINYIALHAYKSIAKEDIKGVNHNLVRIILLDVKLECLKKHAYKCPTCGKELDTNNSYLDHNHKTGLIRGALCNSCNMYAASLELDESDSKAISIRENIRKWVERSK